MGFIDDIKKSFTEREIPAPPTYRALIFGDNAVYLEGVKKIISYDSNEINLSLKKGGVKITGEGLYVKKYCMGDVCLCGKITAIERTI